jgi:aminopeptidase N
VPDETTLVHELAHQWFGDAVTLRQWPDIWLHEGFAEWSEWIWSERHGGPSAQDFFDDLVAENDPGTWDPAPGLITDAADLFSNSV